MEIYSIKSLEGQDAKLFATLDAMAKWLNAKNPIDGKFIFRRGEDTAYNITAHNLEEIYSLCKADGQAPVIIIRQDFLLGVIETEYVYSTLEVIE